MIFKHVWAINSFQPCKTTKMLQMNMSARAVFIPKPGKASYAETKSFRPISVIPFYSKNWRH